ncbi:glyoxalase [Lachnoclostridium sp. Marseille-P6806]|uniref:glyoxalase n=1 Tax=Lachnoclostridium sp. Marseille-P6806 TaxID=2364793 RepID=UPI0010326344|nr:glyoxalase [Lachnoclostridium sp. Marseille-P6806]
MYDKAVIQCFLEKQLQLFPEEVAGTPEEAEAFLEDCLAVVADSAEEVLEYFEEAGADLDGATAETIVGEAEVFAVGDGRYLIVEG